jgi:SSS family solute:Na+ symporter
MFFKFVQSAINAGAVAMIGGLIIVPVVSLLTPKMNERKLNEIFRCFDEAAVDEALEDVDDSLEEA